MRPLVHEKPDWVTVYSDLKNNGFKNLGFIREQILVDLQ